MAFLRLIFFFSIFVFLTACTSAARPTYSTELEMIVNENGFSAVRWYIPAAETIQVNISNQSSASLTLYFLAPSVSKTPGEAWFSVQISPGEEKRTSFTAPSAPGEYDITARFEEDPKISLNAEIVVIQP